jgi:cell division septum initiation protein DivIVA
MSSTYEDLMVDPTIAIEPTEAGIEVTEPIEAEVTEPTTVPIVTSAPAVNSSSAAARLLEIAARNADQLLTEAQAEADEMRASAREEADELLTQARTEAERVRSELELSRTEANDEIAGLRETEQTHRDQMRDHLHEMLAKVEANSIV